jgi:hypothetical protein
MNALTELIAETSAVLKMAEELVAKGPFEDGVGIASVKQTTTSTADSGSNIITITLTDGTTSTFTVRNGAKGSKGDTPILGKDYFTPAEKAEMVNSVLSALPIYNGEVTNA